MLNKLVKTKHVFCFDAYGTLFDVHSAIMRFEKEIGKDAHSLSQLWRTKQLEYSWVYSLSERYHDFWHITQIALDYALACHAISNSVLRAKLLDAYWRLDCYREVLGSLQKLKAKGRQTAILSNGTNDMLMGAIKSNNLEGLFDCVISVDPLECYKTKPCIYEAMLEQLACSASACLFMSSNRWDIAGASSFGFDSVWINRNNMPDEYHDYQPVAERRDISFLT